jgi:hypothetical protein
MMELFYSFFLSVSFDLPVPKADRSNFSFPLNKGGRGLLKEKFGRKVWLRFLTIRG